MPRACARQATIFLLKTISSSWNHTWAGVPVSGGKLKEAGSKHWDSPTRCAHQCHRFHNASRGRSRGYGKCRRSRTGPGSYLGQASMNIHHLGLGLGLQQRLCAGKTGKGVQATVTTRSSGNTKSLRIYATMYILYGPYRPGNDISSGSAEAGRICRVFLVICTGKYAGVPHWGPIQRAPIPKSGLITSHGGLQANSPG